MEGRAMPNKQQLLDIIGIQSQIAQYGPDLGPVMNLVVVVYLIFQGIVPTITLNLADSLGKRPVIIVCLVIYIGACIGIAVANKFWLLIF